MRRFFFPSRATAVACALALAALASSGSNGSAAMIVYDGQFPQNGSGFGTVLNLLALQESGQNTTEAGSVLRNAGGTADVLNGDTVANQSQTQSVADLVAAGVSPAFNNLSLMLQVNQQGSDLNLNLTEFTLRFYTSADASSSFDVQWNANDPAENPGGTSPQPFAGVGVGHADFLFTVSLTDAERTAFFANDGNRIGMIVTTAITNANDGPDNFFLLHDDRTNPVPAPAGLLLALTGMPVLGLGAWVRRRRAAAA